MKRITCNNMTCQQCNHFGVIDSGYGHCKRLPPVLVNINITRWWQIWKPYKETPVFDYPIIEWDNRICGEFNNDTIIEIGDDDEMRPEL